MSEERGEKVFVYGTLRRGGSNDFRMARARFVATGMVRGRLYRIDWYPGFVADESAGLVTGEIFLVDADILVALDEFEGSGYRRVKIAIDVGEGAGSAVEAWIWEWIGNVDETSRIVSGDWLAEA